MTIYQNEPQSSHGEPPRTGVLLVNLGSPDAPTPEALRRYLAEFLWDPRVVEQPRLLWWLILHGIILRVRPRRSAKAYAAVWTEEGPPLLAISRRQCQALRGALHEQFNGQVVVELAMRYGQPAVASGLQALRRHNVSRLLVLPLYPQYSASTTATVFDAVVDVLKTWRRVPELRMINHYYDEPGYIAALAKSVKAHWAAHGRANKLILSFHGIPKRYARGGDPYADECAATARLLATALGLADGEWLMTFQSRFGREEWLQPYTDHTLAALAKEGVDSVDVICPGFAADCLETLEEIARENRDIFLENGGKTLRYIPALNDRFDHIQFLARLVERHIGGWPIVKGETESPQTQDRGAEAVLPHS